MIRKLLFYPLEWLEPVVIDSGSQMENLSFLFSLKTLMLGFLEWEALKSVSKVFLAISRFEDSLTPLSSCTLMTNFTNWLCQHVLMIPRNSICGGF